MRLLHIQMSLTVVLHVIMIVTAQQETNAEATVEMKFKALPYAAGSDPDDFNTTLNFLTANSVNVPRDWGGTNTEWLETENCTEGDIMVESSNEQLFCLHCSRYCFGEFQYNNLVHVTEMQRTANHQLFTLMLECEQNYDLVIEGKSYGQERISLKVSYYPASEGGDVFFSTSLRDKPEPNAPLAGPWMWKDEYSVTIECDSSDGSGSQLTDDKDNHTGLIAGLVSGVVVLSVIIILVIFFIRRRLKMKIMKYRKPQETELERNGTNKANEDYHHYLPMNVGNKQSTVDENYIEIDDALHKHVKQPVLSHLYEQMS